MSDVQGGAIAAQLHELERRLARTEERLSVLEDLDDRVDNHDKDLEAIRAEIRGFRRELSLMRTDVGRIADAQTSHGMVLEKIHSSQEQLVRLLTASVVVKQD